MEKIPFKIGCRYKYYNCDDIFILKKVVGCVFMFECGHWCTDSVFMDLINIKIGKQVFEMMPNFNQLKLF